MHIYIYMYLHMYLNIYSHGYWVWQIMCNDRVPWLLTFNLLSRLPLAALSRQASGAEWTLSRPMVIMWMNCWCCLRLGCFGWLDTHFIRFMFNIHCQTHGSNNTLSGHQGGGHCGQCWQWHHWWWGHSCYVNVIVGCLSTEYIPNAVMHCMCQGIWAHSVAT